MSELYKAIAGSPITYLAGDISAGQTTIAVADDTALPDAPNICTIGYGENIETIRYGAKSNGVLQNVTRGIEGTPRPWPAGTEVARFFTAYDHNSILEGMVKKAGDTITGTLIFNNAIGIQGKDTNGDIFGLLSLNDSNEVTVGSKWKKAKILNNGFVSSDGTNEWNVWHNGNCFASPQTTGFQELESGVIIQWGTVDNTNGVGGVQVSFPKTFKTVFSVVATPVDTAIGENNTNAWVTGLNKYNFYLRTSRNSNVRWIAVGIVE